MNEVRSLKDPDNALQFLEFAKSLIPRINDPELDSEYHRANSEYYLFLPDTEQALIHASRAIEIAKKHGLPDWEFYLLHAKICNRIKRKKDAAKSILRCIEGIDRIKKKIPEEYHDAFASHHEIKEAFKLMETLPEFKK